MTAASSVAAGGVVNGGDLACRQMTHTNAQLPIAPAAK